MSISEGKTIVIETPGAINYTLKITHLEVIEMSNNETCYRMDGKLLTPGFNTIINRLFLSDIIISDLRLAYLKRAKKYVLVSHSNHKIFETVVSIEVFD